MFIDKILTWARNNGFYALYGSPEQVNAMMQDTDFAASDGGTVLFCHLITDSETTDGRDTATVAVYFCRLCDFDFNGEDLLPVQEELKDTGKQLLHDIAIGNVMTYDGVRWQYGYDDYAENVAWVCLRVTLTALAADCNPREEPAEGGCWEAIRDAGTAIQFSNILETNGTLSEDEHSLCFTNVYDSRLVIEKTGTLAIHVLPYGGAWEDIEPVDGVFTLQGYPGGTIVKYEWGIN